MEQLRLGIAGLGHVGCGLIELVRAQDGLRLPAGVTIRGVTARTRERERLVDVSEYEWFDTAESLAVHPEIDVFVELVGGSEGPARRAVEEALKAGKSVVTANKALIAEHGMELAKLADDNGADLLFEAAVAGGVPIVRALRDSLSGVQVKRVSGILNGTCNFLTSEMLSTGRDYGDVLAEAQKLGYAEADPALDVSGTDAAHKIAILSSIAFTAKLDFSKVSIDGVEDLSLLDLQFAERVGYTVKLIAEGVLTDRGVVCRVEPKVLESNHPLARVNGSLNSVRVEGDPLGAIVLTGPGAGGGPTASAVMGDISKLFKQGQSSPLGWAAHHPVRDFIVSDAGEASPWFLRVQLSDVSGALAALSDILAKEGVSIDKLLQDSADENGHAPVAIVTHSAGRENVARAVKQLAKLSSIVGEPRLIRIEMDH
ncbi:MAG: homoserine dehydrogenase [Hyphomonadaceae bacterium]